MCLMHQGPLAATEMRVESEKSTPILTAFPDKTLSRTFSYCLLHHTPDLLPPLTFPPILFFNYVDFCCYKLQRKRVSIQAPGTIVLSGTRRVCRKSFQIKIG